MYTIGPLKEVNMVLFLRKKRFNFMLFWAPKGGGCKFVIAPLFQKKGVYTCTLAPPPLVTGLILEVFFQFWSGEFVLLQNIFPPTLNSMILFVDHLKSNFAKFRWITIANIFLWQITIEKCCYFWHPFKRISHYFLFLNMMKVSRHANSIL